MINGAETQISFKFPLIWSDLRSPDNLLKTEKRKLLFHGVNNSQWSERRDPEYKLRSWVESFMLKVANKLWNAYAACINQHKMEILEVICTYTWFFCKCTYTVYICTLHLNLQPFHPQHHSPNILKSVSLLVLYQMRSRTPANLLRFPPRGYHFPIHSSFKFMRYFLQKISNKCYQTVWPCGSVFPTG